MEELQDQWLYLPEGSLVYSQGKVGTAYAENVFL